MVKFKATNDEIKNLFAVATNASSPMGLGYLHYTNKVFTSADFDDQYLDRGTDYVQGRMVKLRPRKVSDGIWKVEEPDIEYQSWSKSFPTARSLVEAAGLVVE